MSINSLPTVTPAQVRALPDVVDSIAKADHILRTQCGVSARTVRANLRIVAERATDAQRSAGLAWYSLAIAEGAKLEYAFKLPAGVGACIISALSPRTRWSDNLRHAYIIAEGYVPMGAMGANVKRAQAVMGAWQRAYAADERHAVQLSAARAALGQGPKVSAFARNCAGDLYGAVTIDVWAVRAALAPQWKRNCESGKFADAALTRKGVYSALAYLYAVEAHRAGVAPAQYQAIVWCSISNFTG